MNRPATAVLAIAFSLSAGSAMAQTAPNDKLTTKPIAMSMGSEQPAVTVVALAPLAAKSVETKAPETPETVAYPISAYMRGQSLEASNRRLALAAYRQAAEQGHGPSQKRLWELLKDTPGSESVATVYQKEAWNQRVPGVPEPLSPVRFN